jgi:hypothetical protein
LSQPATPLRRTARRIPKNRLSYSGLRTYPKRMTTPHRLSIRLRSATPRIGAFVGSGTPMDNRCRAAVGHPPLPFYFLKKPPFFSNTRTGAAWGDGRQAAHSALDIREQRKRRAEMQYDHSLASGYVTAFRAHAFDCSTPPTTLLLSEESAIFGLALSGISLPTRLLPLAAFFPKASAL